MPPQTREYMLHVRGLRGPFPFAAGRTPNVYSSLPNLPTRLGDLA
jgi:hypothetical protein